MHHGILGYFGTLNTVYIVILTIKTLNLKMSKMHYTGVCTNSVRVQILQKIYHDFIDCYSCYIELLCWLTRSLWMKLCPSR